MSETIHLSGLWREPLRKTASRFSELQAEHGGTLDLLVDGNRRVVVENKDGPEQIQNTTEGRP